MTIVGQDKPLYSINKYGIEKSDHVTTVSNFQKRYIKEEFGIQKDIAVIYNFIDTDVFKAANGNRCDRNKFADDDEKIIMHISNFREAKNPIGAVKAFAEASKKIKARLLLVGDGPEITTIKLKCRELQVCDKVSYLGKVDHVENIIPLADVILQPSYLESFGMVLLEAMACEVSTVSSNIDGIPEVVSEGETGFMFSPNDYEGMGDAIVRICKNEELAESLGKAGRQRAMDYFHKDKIIHKYLQCYQATCGS